MALSDMSLDTCRSAPEDLLLSSQPHLEWPTGSGESPPNHPRSYRRPLWAARERIDSPTPRIRGPAGPMGFVGNRTMALVPSRPILTLDRCVSMPSMRPSFPARQAGIQPRSALTHHGWPSLPRRVRGVLAERTAARGNVAPGGLPGSHRVKRSARQCPEAPICPPRGRGFVALGPFADSANFRTPNEYGC